jgi:hypothetical protein
MDDCKADFVYICSGDVLIAVNFYLKKNRTNWIWERKKERT